MHWLPDLRLWETTKQIGLTGSTQRAGAGGPGHSVILDFRFWILDKAWRTSL